MYLQKEGSEMRNRMDESFTISECLHTEMLSWRQRIYEREQGFVVKLLIANFYIHNIQYFGSHSNGFKKGDCFFF